MQLTNKDEREAFLKKLINECIKEDVYSVIETVEKMGGNYKQLQELAKTDEDVARDLKFCREVCFDNAESGELKGKIFERTTLKYMCENSEEFKAIYEKELAAEERSRLEKEGREILPTQTERLVMNEEIIKKSEQLVSANTNASVLVESPLPMQKTQANIEQERLEQWREKKKSIQPCVKFKRETIKDKDGKEAVAWKGEPSGSTLASYELAFASFSAATGSADMGFASMIQSQIINALFKGKDDNNVDTINSINAVLLSLNPKDEFEGMLCSRLIVLHDQYMEFMRRTTFNGQTDAGIDLNINRSTKLMRLYNETLDALNKHRRKGEQKVTVQHINVREGGQAIVNGQLNQGEGVDAKK